MDLTRNTLRRIAQETVEVLDNNSYTNNLGNKISFSQDLKASVRDSTLWMPEELDSLINREKYSKTNKRSIKVDIRNETCLVGAQRLATNPANSPICLLNFASAKNPGGGFLTGAQAQEESIARSSGLYASLMRFPEYYDYHNKHNTPLYSDRIIFTPCCPVFRNDSGQWLDEPYYIDIITCAAPNVNAIDQGGIVRFGAEDIAKKIVKILYERAEKILALAQWSECKTLILGAWGCGAFGCPPEVVAKVWKDLIGSYGPDTILMDVYDNHPGTPIYNVFEQAFK